MTKFLSSGGFSVGVEGLERAARIPGLLEIAQRQFVHAACESLAEAIGKSAPGGRTGRVGRTWRGYAITDTAGLLESEHPGAKALDQGAYIVPKGLRNKSFSQIRRMRRYIRFRVEGREIFVPAVRLKPTHYVRRGLRPRRQIVLEQFNRFFGHLPI